ncbi:MAG: type 4a pilus biogenesis protein PilO [Elusimicrobiota bacterium]
MNIKLTKEQQQALVLAVLFLGGGGFAYVRYFWMPTSKRITELKTEFAQVQESIKVAKKAQADYEKIQKALVTLEAELKVLIESLPKEKDLPGVIDTVSALTKKHNIKLSGISYTGETKAAGYAEVKYELKIQTSYHDLGKFLAALALEKRLFCARDINFGAPDGEGKMYMVLKLVAYQYLE